jgi:hypothetical protein
MLACHYAYVNMPRPQAFKEMLRWFSLENLAGSDADAVLFRELDVKDGVVRLVATPVDHRRP